MCHGRAAMCMSRGQRVSCKRATHTPYGFGAPDAGLTFINFRAAESSNVQMLPEGEQPPYNERDHFKANAVAS